MALIAVGCKLNKRTGKQVVNLYNRTISLPTCVRDVVQMCKEGREIKIVRRKDTPMELFNKYLNKHFNGISYDVCEEAP